jgi:hypothetical protein
MSFLTLDLTASCCSESSVARRLREGCLSLPSFLIVAVAVWQRSQQQTQQVGDSAEPFLYYNCVGLCVCLMAGRVCCSVQHCELEHVFLRTSLYLNVFECPSVSKS